MCPKTERKPKMKMGKCNFWRQNNTHDCRAQYVTQNAIYSFHYQRWSIIERDTSIYSVDLYGKIHIKTHDDDDDDNGHIYFFNKIKYAIQRQHN